ncbi:MAG: diguanylate cyclase [Alphaproteobacteria bacterium]|nr:diguanylate cyclase [Alphaproteobacteria bacterium]
MSHLAYILIGDPDPECALSRAEFLTNAGYRCIQASDAHSLIGLAGSRTPDVILMGQFTAPVDSLNIIRALKTADATHSIPIVLLDLPHQADLLSLVQDEGVDDILQPNDDNQELLLRLPRLTRSSVMQAELARRLKTASEFGLTVDPKSFNRAYPQRPQVMAVAPDDDSMIDLVEALNGGGFECMPETGYFRAADALDGGRFDAAVIMTASAEDFERTQYLCGHIRHNPRLFNMPTLVLTAPSTQARAKEFYRGGASIVLSGLSDADRLCTYIHMLVSRQRLRWTLRDPFKATLKDETADVSGVAYSKEFWEAHLARTMEIAHARNARLAMAYLSIPTLPRIEEEYGKENAEILAHQLADWITSMTRIEDTVARIAPDAFGILLPETPRAEASGVVQRIIGILHNSEFNLGEDVMQSVRAWAIGSATALEPEDTPESFQARAKASAN